jgi:hypothetical protein
VHMKGAARLRVFQPSAVQVILHRLAVCSALSLEMLAISEPQRFQMGSRTSLAIWIITLAILTVIIAAAFYSLAL